MRRKSQPKDGQSDNARGFTLLEVLLVLTLLAGVGFVLLVKLPVQAENRNLSLASTQLIQELRDVRASAIAENTWYEIRFYPSDNTYRIFREGVLEKTIALPEKISFANQPNTVRFSAEGVPIFLGGPILSGSIFLTNGKDTRYVITALITGRVREEIR
ncbi:MAG TPA: prepilin-type N-terminal cleavage/methylation domain-containing protein [Desulfitobacterium dehalogenans]|uniref:Prepilin-type N-terminal cleavage/methylation domain-containing protein n=1 Tax=Desulfitobacterium dehalogenans TaxID=36854 RepID=A0A7C7DAI0_9FIRM|nr:prepilin-type N-terminal cleavage/methylation domain-containing protein [Desulfitobacterium dehalogenans]